ncbi:hypothetical protein JCM11641_002717 [Rhodosporidiobolus odoratus]
MSSDSDDNLIAPSALFARLAAPRTNCKKPTRPQPTHSTQRQPGPSRQQGGAVKGSGQLDVEQTQSGGASVRAVEPERRRSPRRVERDKVNLNTERDALIPDSQSLPASSLSSMTPPPSIYPPVHATEAAEHADLAALLFPPSSPAPAAASTSSAQVFLQPRENGGGKGRQGARPSDSGTVISDSEEERVREKEGEGNKGKAVFASTPRPRPEPTPSTRRVSKKEPLKPRSSTLTFDLSLSSSDDDDEGLHDKWALPTFSSSAGKVDGSRKVDSHLTEGMNKLSVRDSGSPLPPKPKPRPAAPLVPTSFYAPIPSTSSPPSPTRLAGSLSNAETRIPARSRREKRRITISVLSSSSASSSTSEDDMPAARRNQGKGKGRGRGRGKAIMVEEEEEVLAACTDEEDEERAPDKKEERPFPDDVVRTQDGVFIYDPTPKKRPVKISLFSTSRPSVFPSNPSSPSITPPAGSTPSLAGKGARTAKPKGGGHGGGKSGLGKEIDLTASSSSSEAESKQGERLVPPYTKLFPPTPSTKSTTPRPRPRPAPPTKNSTTTSRTAPNPSSLLTPSTRSSLPLALIRELDRTVFRKKWDGMRVIEGAGGGKGLPDGIEVVWNKRLRNTAGRASWKTIKHHSPSKSLTTTRHLASIELATKVTDTEEKLKHTLSHELCHLAAWAIEGEMKPPHGRAFKLWAARIMQLRPDISITTTHSYEIVYKYRWKCLSGVCGKIFGRHSNSINPATHGCPCGSRLVPIDKDGNVRPSAVSGGSHAGSAGAGGMETPQRKKSKWQEFMVTQSPIIRASNPSLPQCEILKLVAEKWKIAKVVPATAAENSFRLERETGRRGEEVEDGLEELGKGLGGLNL